MKRLTIRLSDETYFEVSKLAQIDNRSVNSEVIFAIKTLVNFTKNPEDFFAYHLKSAKIDTIDIREKKKS